MTESALVREMLLASSRVGARLFRNNQGVAIYPDGSRVQYGVAHPGGSDLLGWKPTLITPEMVGRRFARFVAIEAKTERGRLTQQQRRFLEVVAEAGGIGTVARSTDDVLAALQGGLFA